MKPTKIMKKMFSFLLTVVMVMSVVTTAFAADSYTITINNKIAGYTYSAYQIFDGNLSEGKLSNVVWGSGVANDKITTLMQELQQLNVGGNTPFSTCVYAKDVANVLSATGNDDNATVKAFADVVNKYLSTTSADSSTMSDSRYEISVSDAGYYLVKNTVVPTVDGENNIHPASYTNIILKVVGNVMVAHKDSVPTVDKSIVEVDSNVDKNAASIGDIITYQFTGTMPSNIDDYNTYYYKFTDTMSHGLTYNEDSINVKVNDVDVTKYFYINTTIDANKTILNIGIPDLLALEKLGDVSLNDITNSSNVVVTYNARLNENAIIGENGNENKVNLVYSNDPNDDGTPAQKAPDSPETNMPIPVPKTPTGTTLDSKVYTFTTSLIIKKVDENGNSLTGAAFKIEGESVNAVVTTADVYVETETGTYYKLKDGTYTTSAPNINDDESDVVDLYDDINKKYELKHVATIIKGTNNNVNVEAFVNSSGTITFAGLGVGTYEITETVTPSGFNSIDPFEVKISWNKGNTDDGKCTWTYIGTDEVETNGNRVNTNRVTVMNKSGSSLPSTGGIGTTIFYIIGGILVVGAGVILITRHRMDGKE